MGVMGTDAHGWNVNYVLMMLIPFLFENVGYHLLFETVGV